MKNFLILVIFIFFIIIKFFNLGILSKKISITIEKMSRIYYEYINVYEININDSLIERID